MTSEKNGDDSVTDAADASVDALADESAAFTWAGDDLDATAAPETAVSQADAPEGAVEEAFDSVTSGLVENETGPDPDSAAGVALEETAEPAPTAATDPDLARRLLTESNPEPQPVAPAEFKREPLSNASLVLVGLLAGVYLLYSIGWYIGGGRIDAARGTLLSDFGYHATFWLAVALPPLWFTASMLGTKKKWTRLTALLIGVVLCIPWPFVMVGALGV